MGINVCFMFFSKVEDPMQSKSDKDSKKQFSTFTPWFSIKNQI